MTRGDFLVRILVTAACLTTWRVLTLVPAPGIDLQGVAPTEAVSVVALGLQPYVITLALIVPVRVLSSTFNRIIRDGSTASYGRWEMLFVTAVAAWQAHDRIHEWQTTTTLLPGHMPGSRGSRVCWP